MPSKKSESAKVPSTTNPKPISDLAYGEMARAQLSKTIQFHVRAKGHDDVLTGVMVAFIAKGSKLSEVAIKADPKQLEGFVGAETVRPRASVCVVRTNDSGSGAVRFFTPRPQQVRW